MISEPHVQSTNLSFDFFTPISEKLPSVKNRFISKTGKQPKRMFTPYTHEAYRAYFAVIKQLGIEDQCIEPDPFNKGGTRDTIVGAKLYRVIYEALKLSNDK